MPYLYSTTPLYNFSSMSCKEEKKNTTVVSITLPLYLCSVLTIASRGKI